jgi:translation initiation factor 4E
MSSTLPFRSSLSLSATSVEFKPSSTSAFEFTPTSSTVPVDDCTPQALPLTETLPPLRTAVGDSLVAPDSNGGSSEPAHESALQVTPNSPHEPFSADGIFFNAMLSAAFHLETRPYENESMISVEEEMPLQNEWSLWYNAPSSSKQGSSWLENMVRVSTFSTVQGFWRCMNNIPPPSQLLSRSNYHLFKSEITPEWENEFNLYGGKWVHSFNSSTSPEFDSSWIYTALSLVGEHYDTVEEQINGLVVSPRPHNGSRLSLWTSNSQDQEACMLIGSIFKQTVMPFVGELDSFNLRFKIHSDRSITHGNEVLYYL